MFHIFIYVKRFAPPHYPPTSLRDSISYLQISNFKVGAVSSKDFKNMYEC